MSRTTTVKSAVVAAAIITGALGLSTLTAQPASATYNVGVKSLHLEPVADSCSENQALPCTPGAGEGQPNVLEVHQTKVNGYHKFNRLQGTSRVDDAVWLSAEIGAECRRAHHLTELNVDGNVGVPEGDGLAGWGAFAPDSDPFAFPNGIPFSDGRTMAVKKLALNVEFHELFGGMVGAVNAQHLFDAGEAEIADRIASGMSAAQARGTAFESVLWVTVFAEVRCKYNGVIQAEYYKRRSTEIPLLVRYVPTEVDAPVGGRRPSGGGGNDLIDSARVTDAALSVVSDPDDACTLHLSGTIQTNRPTQVEYRFIDPHGQPSNTYSIDIDQTLTGFFSRSVEVPHAPNSDIGGDFAAEHGDAEIGGFAAEGAAATDRYVGTYMLEVLSPNHESAADGFNVPFCGATVDPISFVHVQLGMIYRF